MLTAAGENIDEDRLKRRTQRRKPLRIPKSILERSMAMLEAPTCLACPPVAGLLRCQYSTGF